MSGKIWDQTYSKKVVTATSNCYSVTLYNLSKCEYVFLKNQTNAVW